MSLSREGFLALLELVTFLITHQSPKVSLLGAYSSPF